MHAPVLFHHIFCAFGRCRAQINGSRAQMRASVVAQAGAGGQKFDYDLVIIGCGVGGHGAALHAVEQVRRPTAKAPCLVSVKALMHVCTIKQGRASFGSSALLASSVRAWKLMLPLPLLSRRA